MAPDYARDAQDTNNALRHEAERIKEALGMDAVRIVATGSVGDGMTGCFAAGVGNWHAQYGAICETHALMTDNLGLAVEIGTEDDDD